MILSDIYLQKINVYHVLSTKWRQRESSPFHTAEAYHADSAPIMLWGLTQSVFVSPFPRCSPPYTQEAPTAYDRLLSTPTDSKHIRHPVVTIALVATSTVGGVHYGDATAADAP